MPSGGKREGAGRPKLKIKKKMYSFRLSVEEHEKIRKLLKQMRGKNNETF